MSKEQRFYLFDDANISIEKREDGTESRKVVGYAAVFDKWSRNFSSWFREKIDREAFKETDMSDTVALFNHNSDKLLARAGGTLKLSVDEIGLRYEFEAPNTTAGNDLLENIRRGDVRGSSFAFTVKEDEWTESESDQVEEDRIIRSIGMLYDVGPVTFPAYPDTIVAGKKRSFEEHREEEKQDGDRADSRATDEKPEENNLEVFEKELELYK